MGREGPSVMCLLNLGSSTIVVTVALIRAESCPSPLTGIGCQNTAGLVEDMVGVFSVIETQVVAHEPIQSFLAFSSISSAISDTTSYRKERPFRDKNPSARPPASSTFIGVCWNWKHTQFSRKRPATRQEGWSISRRNQPSDSISGSSSWRLPY
jgi:hypothetical protein